MKRALFFGVVLLCTATAPAQTDAAHGGMPAGKPGTKASTSLTVTGLGGKVKTLTPAEFQAFPHVTVTVHNAHNNKDESYSGVPVRELLAIVAPAQGEGPSASSNMQVVVAGATDGFLVVITLCDTNPGCRSGQAIVADREDGESLRTDGAFKLILTEDKKPARWARNLDSLTVRGLDPK